MTTAPAAPAPPAVSIVVPVLNEALHLPMLLAALAPLRRAGAEVIVVDGSSSDGSAAVAAPHADAVISSPRGRATQMNAGAAAARAPWLLFLHADTQLPADALAAITVSRADWGRFDVRIDGRSRWLPVVAAFMNLRSRLTGIATGDQAIFVRADSFVRVGGYPEQALMEDIELSRRLKRLGRPQCLAGPVRSSGRRWDEHGFWRTVTLMWWLRLAYRLGLAPDRLARWYYGRGPRGTAGA